MLYQRMKRIMVMQAKSVMLRLCKVDGIAATAEHAPGLLEDSCDLFCKLASSSSTCRR